MHIVKNNVNLILKFKRLIDTTNSQATKLNFAQYQKGQISNLTKNEKKNDVYMFFLGYLKVFKNKHTRIYSLSQVCII